MTRNRNTKGEDIIGKIKNGNISKNANACGKNGIRKQRKAKIGNKQS